MFDSSYPYRFVHTLPAQLGEPFIQVHIYTFRGKQRIRYIARVEEYTDLVFVPKFYLKHHQNSPDRYSLHSGAHDMQAVVRTMVNIMLELLLQHPAASFGFIGMEDEGEKREDTRRYRIYAYVMRNFFSALRFWHYPLQAYSAYLMLNKASSASLDELKERFLHYYPKSEQE